MKPNCNHTNGKSINESDNNSTPTNAAQENRPVIPLPNPGEGGPVFPGPSEGTMEENRPVIPLPSPGEGGPVFPAYPNIGRPDGGMGPTTGNMIPNVVGTIISTHPRPNVPCTFCNPISSRNGRVRFLNAASDYNPFIVFVNENMFANPLNFAEVTEYENVSSGNQVITIMGENGYIYVQKNVNVPQNGAITIAIINTDSGLDLEVVADEACDRTANMSCVRVANLSYNSGPLSVVIGNQYLSFTNVRYREVADFMSIWPGMYMYTVSKSGYARVPGMGNNVLLTASINMLRNKNYTIYLFNWNKNSTDTIKAMTIEEL